MTDAANFPSPHMQLRFTIQEDDIVAFSRKYNAASPTIQRARTLRRWFLPAALLILLVVMPMVNHRAVIDWVSITVFVTLSVAWYVLSPISFDRRIDKYTRRMVREKSYQGALGSCELTLADDGLRSISPMGESHYHWSTLRRVELTEEHLFIFLSGPLGYPVPIASVGHEAAKEAHDLIRQKAGLGQPTR